MRTARLLTAGKGGCVQGVCRGCVQVGYPVGVSRLVHTSPDQEADPGPLCGQTNTCKNITLPQTSFAGGKNVLLTNSIC